jgi:mRNA interferase YafQ
MREIVRSAQFRRDVKLAEKRGKDMAKLRELVLLLAEDKPLPPRCRDHPLGGDWKHYAIAISSRIGCCSTSLTVTIST